MKLRAMLITAVFAILFLITGNLYAGSGDLIVTGNLGVGTPAGATPAAKAEINGNLLVDNTATVKGNMTINTTTTDTTTINGAATIKGAATMNSTTTVNGNAIVNGNLGVGVPSPTKKLEVNGAVRATQGTMLYSCPTSNCPGTCVGQATTASTCTHWVYSLGACREETQVTENCSAIGRLMMP